MNSDVSIVWFYHDLRLADNAALGWAAARGRIVPLYIHDDSGDAGGASAWWLHQALRGFADDLSTLGIDFILRHGSALSVLRTLIKETGATSVTWARRYEPALAARDAAIDAALEKDGIEVKIHTGFLLFEPEKIRTGSGTVFKVFTPFSKACFAAPAPLPTLAVPKLQGIKDIRSDDVETWKLVPKTAQWPDGLADAWQAGEKAAHKMLRDFIKNKIVPYKTMRDRPDVAGTSRLSPYLHFGHISPRQIWHAMHKAQMDSPACDASAHRYLLEILWREFSWHLLCVMPDLPREPLQKSFAQFPWRKDAAALQAWQRGQTGYPIVDAGMHELWQTGWMHNRVRMIVASFLIKHLLIDWREGMAWFWDTLVDADLGSNTASWQWVAGCGADAAPYFRIFNPILQGQKFDPNGDYVRRFLPELEGLDNAYIHEPWEASAAELAKSGVILGKTYPKPIVEHGFARKRALAALRMSKGAEASELPGLFD